MKKLYTILLFVFLLIGCSETNNNLERDLVLSLDEAKEIALSHGFLKKEDVEFTVEELIDANPSYYLLVINEQDKNHMYKVDSKSGKILISSDQENKESIKEEVDNTKDKTVQKTEEDKTTSTNSNKKTESQTNSPTKNINRDTAVNIALNDLVISKSQISKLEVKEKVKNNTNVIEVEFYHNNYDGSIMKKEIEYKGTLDNSKQITFAQAKALALAKVSGANDNHIKIKEDYEDGRKVYEGKIIYNGYEYEFEIDANSGIFLEWEVERLH